MGNKCDLEDSREVSADEGKALADSFGVAFMETSAKDTINISDAFVEMSKTVIGKMHEVVVKQNEEVHISEVARNRKNEESKCC